jgi:CHAT domain-containing protein
VIKHFSLFPLEFVFFGVQNLFILQSKLKLERRFAIEEEGSYMKSRLNLLLLLCAFSAVQAQPLIEAQHTLFQRGDYEQAIRQWQSVLTRNPSHRFQAWLGIAQANRYMGAYNQALDTLNTAIPFAQQTKNVRYHALLLNELSKVRLSQGEKWFEEALQQGETALELARESKRPEVLAEVLNHWGNLLTADDDYEEAIEAYSEAVQLSKEDFKTLYSKILINQAKIFFLLDAEKAARRKKKKPRFQTSIAALEKALQAIQTSQSDSYSQVLGLITISQIIQQIQTRYPSLTLIAYQALKTAREKAYRLDNALAKTFANGYMGALYEQAKRYQEALLLTRQAVFFAQHTREKPLMYLWQWQTARILKAQGQNSQAIAAYQQAITHLRSVRTKLVSMGYFKIVKSFREEIAPVYFELADLLLQEATSAQTERQREQLLQQAIKTIEFFKEAELQNYFQNECPNISVTECTHIEQMLDAQTAVLYPIPLSDRLELLLHRADGLIQVTVNVSDKTLRKQILSVLSLLRRHPYYQDFDRGGSDNQIEASCTPGVDIPVDKIAKPSPAFLKQAQTLHSWLIEPLLPHLHQINTLIIVPDGALRTIPFAALHDGQQFLIQQYALAITPGLCLSQPQPLRQKEKTILLSGLSEAVQGFSALPCAKSELETIQNLFETTDKPLLLNRQFTIPTLQSELAQKGHSIVHIASHGQFSGNLDKTFILTYDDKLSLNKLEQIMRLATIKGKPVELLTLSACETAVGDDRAALGLAGVALKAGVKSALASLWKVDDIATQAIIIEFYRQLQHNAMSKVKALQKAQTMMLTDKRYAAHQHPYFWSAFLLIGNWF